MALDDLALLAELAPVAGQLYERHLATTKEWFPHELVPWSLGEDFEPGVPWDPSHAVKPWPDATQSALFVNLLTEDNLPYYLAHIDAVFSKGGDAWREWTRRWTAEEGRHSIVIRDYLTVTRAIDPVALERGRMAQVSRAEVPEPPTVMRAMVYLCLQELATRISHRNTGKLLDEPGYKLMQRVAADENFHYLFYRDLVTAALEIDPSEAVIAMEAEVVGFDMPGTGIPEFGAHAREIARAGIYDFSIHHDQILVPVVLRQWGLEKLAALSPDAEAARERLVHHMSRIDRAGRRMAERRGAA